MIEENFVNAGKRDGVEGWRGGVEGWRGGGAGVKREDTSISLLETFGGQYG